MINNRRSILGFITLVFVLSIPFWVLSAIYPIQILPGLPLSALGAFTPAFAALILIYKNERFAGVLRLLSRSFDFKRVKNPVWYFIVVLINPVVAVLAYAFMHAIGKSIPNHLDLSVSVLPMFILFFIAALGEEIIVFVDAVAEAHEFLAAAFVLGRFDEAAAVIAIAMDGLKHFQHRLIGSTVQGTPQCAHSGRGTGKQIRGEQ